MKRNIFILSLLMVSLFSCNEREIEVFKSKPFIAFERSLIDTTLFSFFFHIEDEVKHPFIVKLTGRVFDQDQKFKIEYNKKTTTLDKNLFKLEEGYIFRAGLTQDTIYVTMINHSTLEKEFNLQLNIVGSDEILVNTGLKSSAFMKVSDRTTQPAWWGNEYDEILNDVVDVVYYSYLGQYSEAKYRLFMEVTGVSDLSEYVLIPVPNHEPVRRLSIQFKHYLEAEKAAGREVMDENADPMTVPVVG